MAENSLELPYLAVIPYSILSDKDLEANAKLHFGCLAGLSKKNGYCWATDDQLAEMHEVSTRQILRWMKALESKGYIRRVTENISYRDAEGKLLWKKTRRIYVNDGFSKNVCEHDKNVTINERDKNVTIDERDKNVTYKEEISKKKSLKEKSIVSPKAHSLSVLLFDELRKKLSSYKKPNFEKWDEEMDKILRLDGKTFEELKAIIKWAHASEDPFWKTAFQSPKTVRKMADRALLAMNSKPNVSDEDFAKKVKTELESKTFEINVYEKYIEFRDQKINAIKIIEFGKSFTSRVNDYLQKLKEIHALNN